MRLVHLTDPHLTSLAAVSPRALSAKRRLGYLSWYRSRRHKHRPEVLAQVTAAVAAEDADQIALTGDLTHLGLDHEIEAAAAWLRTLGPPEQVMLVPGNHDAYRRESVAALHRAWGAYLGTRDDGDFPTVRVVADVALVGVTSGCPTPIFLATGRLGADQRNRLGAVLADHRERFRCLLIHHPPARTVSRRKALSDAGALRSILAREPPALVLHGHVHRNLEAEGAGVPVFATASASSAYPDRPAAYRVFDIERSATGWSVSMTLKCLAGSGDMHVAATRTWETGAPQQGARRAPALREPPR